MKIDGKNGKGERRKFVKEAGLSLVVWFAGLAALALFGLFIACVVAMILEGR